MRGYDLGDRKPKNEALERISIAPKVRPKCLSAPEFRPKMEFLYALLENDELMGCAITKVNGKPAIVGSDTTASLTFNGFLRSWNNVKKELNAKGITREGYGDWKERFDPNHRVNTSNGKSPGPESRRDMSRTYRLALMMLSIFVLLIVSFAIYGSPSFLLDSFWFTAGLLLLITLSLVDQPHFSKDANIFINSITAGLSLLLVQSDDRDPLFWTFLTVIAYLLASSYALILIRERTLSTEPRAVQILSRVNRQIGKPEVLFSALFIWGAARQFTMSAPEFNALLVFWIAFMIFDSPAVASMIEGLFDKDSFEKREGAIGYIISAHSSNLYTAELSQTDKEVLGSQVMFSDLVSRLMHSGFVFRIDTLADSVWADIVCERAAVAPSSSQQKLKPGVVYLDDSVRQNRDNFAGLVSAGTTVDVLKFEYTNFTEVSVGELLEIVQGDSSVVYQVTDASINQDALSGPNKTRITIGEAVQLGVWDNTTSRFELFGWVPNPTGIVNKVTPLESTEPLGNSEIKIGTVPGSNYPVIMNKETAVTHHLAILGVTGTGKSHFARSLIRQIADDELRVIVVDLTGEYKAMFPEMQNIVCQDDSEKAFCAIEKLAGENAKFPNQRNQTVIASQENAIKSAFYNSIKKFLEGDETKTVLELPDISNKSSIFEYVRWFFWCLFETSKTKNNFGRRICVVLEEAHTVVPEYNAMGSSDNASKASVNSIAQIALQGRKYNIGLIVIAQRTANVSKTILMQCNSIIAFQEFDKTSTDFLSSYMNQSHLKTLPTLKFRTGIAVGKAFKSTVPMLFEVPFEAEKPAMGKHTP